MKKAIVLLSAAVLLAGCQQSSPGGASGGSTAGQATTDTAAVERSRSLRADKSARISMQTSAASVIFQVLSPTVPYGIDKAMARQGASAIRGLAADRVLLAMAIAARPVVAWPLDPLANPVEAKRWAATVAAAVEVASIAAGSIASTLPVDGADDAGQLETAVLKGFAGLPHADLAGMLDALSTQTVVLDLAETSAVKLSLDHGASLALASDGATLTRAGAVRFSFSSGVLDGSSYSLALDRSTVAALGRTRVMTSTDEASRSTSVGATAGIK